MSALPRCPHFGTCGGCATQDLTYERQLAAKAEAVARAFSAAGLDVPLAPPEPARDPWFYRNRMTYIVGPGPVLGLREPKRWDAIVDLRTCFLFSETGHALANAFREWIRERGLEPYDLPAERGEVRYLVLREGKNTGRRLAIVVLRTAAAFPFDDFAALARAHGHDSAALVLNPTPSDVASGEIARVEGPPLTERVGAVTFEISPLSFFQPSTALAERLVEIARELFGEGGRDTTLVDLYGGVGLFALSLRDRFARVVGVESGASAARDAARNAALDAATNVSIIEDEVERALPSLDATHAIIDPPRSGLRPAAARALAASRIETLVYVSCNPATMARDLAALADTFALDAPIVTIDSLPWTPHVEMVARLSRRRARDGR